MFRQKEGLAFFLSLYLLLTAIALLAAKRAGKYSNGKFVGYEDCLNISVPQWNQPYSFLEPCVKLWTGVNCRGTYVSQEKIGMARSVSDCAACKSRNRTGGLRCTGPKRGKKCVIVPSICDGGFEILETGKEFEILNVPATIEPLDISSFEVLDPSKRQETVGPPIPFIVYRKSDPNQGFDAETVVFMRNEKIVIYIHGFATPMLDDGTNIKNAVFEGTWDVDSVIIVDWRRWSLPYDGSSSYTSNYKIVALTNLPIVAEHVRQFLLAHLHNENYIYLVGFSLGAHVSGTAARELAKNGMTVDRISALDPAGPIFEYTLGGLYTLDTTNTLRVSDSLLIDVIHCSTVLGMVNPAGHLDTYLQENYCILPSCTHRRAVQMYISSLKRCSLITCPMSGETCSPFTVSAYGYLSDLYPGRGIYVLSARTQWWSWNDHDCSEFMNVYLPAKYRVCFEPPTSNGDCYGYPYLTECPVGCANQDAMTSTVCSTNINNRLKYQEASKNHAQSLKVANGKEEQVTWHGGNCTQ